jgi:predicted DNA-binding transcriptional regulator YafY
MMLNQYKRRPHRLVAILKKLHTDANGLSALELSNLADISLRTAQKDFEVIHEVYSDLITKDKQTHRLNVSYENKIKQRASLRLQNRMIIKLALELLEHGVNLTQLKKELTDELELEQLMLPYYIQPEFYETIALDTPIVQLLTRLIEEGLQADIYFRNKPYTVEPYKIVNFDGIWYLYGKDIEENMTKTFSLREITGATLTQQHHKYMKNRREIDQELERLHITSSFKEDKEIKVVIHVRSERAPLFRNRALLHNQEILEVLEDGSMSVSFTVNAYKEVNDVVKSHLPYIEILEPLFFREALLKELEGYISSCKHKYCLS